MSGIQWQDEFLNYLRFEKRYAPHTITAYKKDLQQFFGYLDSEYQQSEPGGVSHFHLRSWLASLKDNKQLERTINRKISSLNSFFKYLLKKQVVQKNPVRLLHSIKVPERLPAFLKEDETSHLMEEIQFEEGFKGFTDRLICDLLYQTGMRRQELLNLKESDIEWSLRQIRVFGKGNKERLIPVSPMMLETLQDYIREKKDMPEGTGKGHLLILGDGAVLYPMYVYRVVKRYLSIITTLKKKSPHVLRHTFATQLLSNGANIQAIKDLLGHSSLAATQIYTHNNIEKLKEVHRLNHPRA